MILQRSPFSMFLIKITLNIFSTENICGNVCGEAGKIITASSVLSTHFKL
jgi:hypothetical protein